MLKLIYHTVILLVISLKVQETFNFRKQVVEGYSYSGNIFAIFLL